MTNRAKIQQLPREEIQKIAAGEVVERPANIVKELIENSIDAGATTITLYIEEGGKKLIRCIDNGHGMELDDARLSIAPHATSKIRCVNDLATITSFGFRGEALASISAISYFTLITRTKEATQAHCLHVQEASIINEEIVSASTGTDITIKDLFYNIPARKKFLKTTETEWRAINHLIYAYTLCYPQLTFTVYHNHKRVHNFPALDDHHHRITSLLGDSSHLTMYQQESSQRIPHIKLFAGQPSFTRYDRQHIFCFVNNRWIKNHKITQAFLRGYGTLVNDGKYPVGCLFITIDPAEIDVNIHPRKEEVVFLHPRRVEELITQTVQEALSQELINAKKTNTSFPTYPLWHQPQTQETEWKFIPTINNALQEPRITEQPSTSNSPYIDNTSLITVDKQEVLIDSFAQAHTDFTYNLVGQAYDTYIILERENGLLFIDQHAAHERILYEQFAARLSHATTVKLLFPETLVIKHEELQKVMLHQQFFHDQGIELDALDETTLVMYSKPVHAQQVALKDIVHELLTTLHDVDFLPHNTLAQEINKKMQAMMACKAAVKAGDQLSREKMHEIVDALMKCQNNTTCPHGRPTWWPLALPELAKKFRRFNQ